MANFDLKYHFIKNFLPADPFDNVSLHQIGLAYCEPETEVPMHYHIDFYEITAVVSGEGILTTNGVDVPIKQNDIYISFPYDSHRIVSNADKPLKYNFLSFFINDRPFAQELHKIAGMYSNAYHRLIKNELLLSLVENAVDEVSADRLYKKEYLNKLFDQIIIQIIRSFTENCEPCLSVPSKSAEFCYQIMYYINTHIYTMNNLKDIADYLKYDYSYLSNIFTHSTKQTISEYYRERRLETAKALIKEENITLSEIAQKLNYSSIYSFSKAFKQAFSISPLEFRKQFRR